GGRGGVLWGGEDRMKAGGIFLRQERSRELSRLPALVLHQRREKRDVVAEAFDVEGVERVGLRGDRLFARWRMGYELGDHGIVVERNFAALVDTGIDAHGYAVRAVLPRRPIAHQAADRRQEVARGILGINAGLDRPARELDVALLKFELFARRHADHLLD